MFKSEKMEVWMEEEEEADVDLSANDKPDIDEDALVVVEVMHFNIPRGTGNNVTLYNFHFCLDVMEVHELDVNQVLMLEIPNLQEVLA